MVAFYLFFQEDIETSCGKTSQRMKKNAKKGFGIHRFAMAYTIPKRVDTTPYS
jgi:hypothetical protein